MIWDICEFSQEVKTGEILDVIKLYQAVKDPSSKEANAEYILEITYPTGALCQFIEFIASKLNKKQTKGVCLAAGGYGAGKSHACLVLYHLANLGSKALPWLGKWGIKVPFPENSRAVAVNLVSESAKNLWEPLFDRAGHPELNAKVGNWPSVEQWKALLSEGPLVFLIDELEDWLEAIPPEARDRNKRALYTLGEAADTPDLPLAVVLVVYGRKPSLYSDALREQPPTYDFSQTSGREKVVLHRLVKNVRLERAKTIVESFIEAYKAAPNRLPSLRGGWDETRARMLASYPFHPHFLENAFAIYGSASHYQGARGVIYLAATLLSEAEKRRWDLITLGCVSPIIDAVALDLRQLNITLTQRCEEDLRLRLKNNPLAESIMASALFLSFMPERRGATLEDIALSLLGPSTNFNDIELGLKDVEVKAWYFETDLVQGRYRIVEEPVLRKVIEQRAHELLATSQGIQKVKEKFREKMTSLLGADAFALEAGVRDEERPVKLVFSSKSLSLDSIREAVKGRSWPNTLVFIGPKQGFGKDILEDPDFLIRVARVVIAETLEIEPKRKEELQRLAGEFRREFESSLKERYGRWLKVIRYKDATGVRYATREVNVELSGEEIWRELQRNYDINAIKEAIREYLGERREAGCGLRELGESFRRLLGFPIIRRDQQWHEALSELVNADREVVVQAGRMLYPYQGSLPSVIQEEWHAWLKDFAPPPPPPPGLKESIERNLRQMKEDGLSLSSLLERVREEGVAEATEEAFQRAIVELVDEDKAVIEDEKGEVRSPEGGPIPEGTELSALWGWHREFAPPDDREVRRRVMEILEEKREIPLGTLASALYGEGFSSAALKRGLKRLREQGKLIIESREGRLCEALTITLTDEYIAKIPEEARPPIKEEEVEVETGICGTPEIMLSLLQDRLLEEGRIMKAEVQAEPQDPTLDPVFGHDWRGPRVKSTHSLILDFDVPTVKDALLAHLGSLKERLRGMRLNVKVKVRIKKHAF